MNLPVPQNKENIARWEIDRILSINEERFKFYCIKVLNIRKNFSIDDVEQGYKKLIKILHPDVCSLNGTLEAIEKINIAYNSLTSKHEFIKNKFDYSDREIESIIKSTYSNIRQIIENCIENDNYNIDVFEKFSEMAQQQIEENNKIIKEKKLKIKKLNKFKKKIKKKNRGKNEFSSFIDEEIKEIENEIEENINKNKTIKISISIVSDYYIEKDKEDEEYGEEIFKKEHKDKNNRFFKLFVSK